MKGKKPSSLSMLPLPAAAVEGTARAGAAVVGSQWSTKETRDDDHSLAHHPLCPRGSPSSAGVYWGHRKAVPLLIGKR